MAVVNKAIFSQAVSNVLSALYKSGVNLNSQKKQNYVLQYQQLQKSTQLAISAMQYFENY